MGFRKTITIADPEDPAVPPWTGEANLTGTWDDARASVRGQIEAYLEAIFKGTHPWRSEPPDAPPAPDPAEHEKILAENAALRVQLATARETSPPQALAAESPADPSAIP